MLRVSGTPPFAVLESARKRGETLKILIRGLEHREAQAAEEALSYATLFEQGNTEGGRMV